MTQKLVQITDVKAFLADRGTKRVGEHAMTKQMLHWRCCAYCGLMNLKNEKTRKLLRKKCVTYE